jgi:hypothetical protein
MGLFILVTLYGTLMMHVLVAHRSGVKA